MAYAKKASRRYRRRAYRKRPYRRRWARSRYRRKYRRRYYKKPEYKRIESRYQWTYTAKLASGNDPQQYDNYRYRFSHPYMFRVIGVGDNVDAQSWGVDIEQGTAQNQRIGAKINPARLKLYLTLALNPNFIAAGSGNTTVDAADVFNAVSFKFRFIVMQVKNGSGIYTPVNNNFSNINPSINDGEVVVSFFDKAFVSGNPGFVKVSDYWKVNPNDVPRMYDLMTAPYRRGLGGQFRILKDKVYTLDSAKGSFYTIKMKSKKPAEMVWVESRTEDNKTYNHPKNPIYLIIIPCPNTFTPVASANISLRYEFLYTDY